MFKIGDVIRYPNSRAADNRYKVIGCHGACNYNLECIASRNEQYIGQHWLNIRVFHDLPLSSLDYAALAEVTNIGHPLTKIFK
jgi:hypothetical protein